ncbi:hypothetical protein FM119_09815 [Mycetocola reblochoni REB411]|uniref:Secreted protein n=1 Tax=Mycetocola reblochoni REB411 TaxID=1255698 RepID=A0A1R4JWJ7_9MICO|nr:hypothetical protein FM119_09815 [Mycetocola reblochoni REB411]
MGLAAGLLVSAAPAQAAAWGGNFSSRIACVAGTPAKVAYYASYGYKPRVATYCEYHKIGNDAPFWYTEIRY